MDILDILLDEDNFDPIVLVSNDQNVTYSFKQIAVIPYLEKVYCILKPITPMDGVSDDEAIVFYVEDGEQPCLMVENDELTALRVFEKYYDLLEEEGVEG